MNDIHPTETGGDGRRLVERQQKPGDPVKHIIKCYQCGYSFIEGRDDQGESEVDGNEYIITTVAINNDQSKLPKPLQGMTRWAASSRSVIEPVVVSSCQFCGTYNPTGVGDEKDYFSTVDLSDK